MRTNSSARAAEPSTSETSRRGRRRTSRGVLPLPDLVRRDPNGGIYLGTGVNPAVWNLVNGAANVWVPRQLDGLGGWQAAVGTIGITDTADSHAGQRSDNDACSTMPQSVKDRIQSEAG